MAQNCIDGSSFSNETDIYKGRLDQTTKIKQDVLDHSKIYETLKINVQELENTKEELINTKSQLEISQNATKLMEVEFAFRSNQYEEEIQRLKNAENDLRQALLNSQAENKKNIHVQADIVSQNAKIETIEREKSNLEKQLKQAQDKNQKLKEKLLLVKEQHQNELTKIKDDFSSTQIKDQSENLQLQEKYNDLKEKYQNISNQFQKIIKQIQQTGIEIDNNIISLSDNKNPQNINEFIPTSNEVDYLSQQIDKIILMLKSKQQKIFSLKQKLKETTSVLSETTSNLSQIKDVLNTIKHENQELKAKDQKLDKQLSRLTKQNKKLMEINGRYIKLKEFSEHIDLEFEVLNDILHVDERDKDIAHEWTHLRDAAKNAYSQLQKVINLNEKIDSLNQLNSNFQTEIESLNAYKEKYQSAMQQINEFKIMSDENAKLQQENKILQKDQKKNNKFSDMLHIRGGVAFALSKNNNDLFKQIILVESSIDQDYNLNNPTLFRPLILFSVFLTRWKRIVSNVIPNVYDSSSLLSLSSIPKSSKSRMDHIVEVFKSLSQNLLQTKETLLQVQNEKISLQLKANQLQTKINNDSAFVKESKKAVKLLKKQIDELEEESAHYVNADDYEKLLSKSASMELENEKLKQELTEAQQSIEEKEIRICNQNRATHDIQLKFDEMSQDYDQARTKIEDQKGEIQKMQNDINEKTKQLLAYERALHDHQKQKMAYSIPVNKTLLSKIEPGPKSPVINPIFLGQGKE